MTVVKTKRRSRKSDIGGLYEVAGPGLFGYVVLMSTGAPVRFFSSGALGDAGRLKAMLPAALKATAKREEYNRPLNWQRFVYQRLVAVGPDGQAISEDELTFRADGSLVEVTYTVTERVLKVMEY